MKASLIQIFLAAKVLQEVASDPLHLRQNCQKTQQLFYLWYRQFLFLTAHIVQLEFCANRIVYIIPMCLLVRVYYAIEDLKLIDSSCKLAH